MDFSISSNRYLTSPASILLPGFPSQSISCISIPHLKFIPEVSHRLIPNRKRNEPELNHPRPIISFSVFICIIICPASCHELMGIKPVKIYARTIHNHSAAHHVFLAFLEFHAHLNPPSADQPQGAGLFHLTNPQAT